MSLITLRRIKTLKPRQNAIVGGNSFVTTSIAPGARVSIKNQELTIKNKDGEHIEELPYGDFI